MSRLSVALALLSAAIIAFQLALMRILSIVQWDHFAALCISVALLGFGASGTLLALARRWFLRHGETLLPLLMLGSGLGMALAVVLSQSFAGGFDTYLLFVDPRQLWLLLLTQGLLLIPMLLGALAIGLCFMRQVERVGGLYAANLIGSAAGGPLALLGMALLLPQQLPAACGLLALLAALLLRPPQRILIAGLLLLAPTLFLLLAAPPSQLSQYKSLSYALDLPGAQLLETRPTPEGLLQMVAAPALRYSAELGLQYRGDLPHQQLLLLNGDQAARLPSGSLGELGRLFSRTPAALAYRLAPRSRVLILDSDLVEATVLALENRADEVVVVSPHPALLKRLARERPWLDSLRTPALRTRARQPRTFLARSAQRFDLIQLPTVGSFGGNAGLGALTQQTLLTVEGLTSAWAHLNDDGLLLVRSWLDAPPRNPLRLTATLVSVLRQAGIDDPAGHLAGLRSWNGLTLLVKRSPFTAADAKVVLAFCAANRFDTILLPGLPQERRSRYHLDENGRLPAMLDRIVAGAGPLREGEYPFRLAPPTDDRPFFSQFLSWRALPRLPELLALRGIPYLELGYLVLWVTFLQLVLAALLLILAPLLRLGRRGGGLLCCWGYFSALGIGFMFFEMALLQQLVRYLGQPLYAAAAAISTLLFFSGLGSFWSGRLPLTGTLLRKLLLALVVVLLLYPLVVAALLSATIHLPLPVRALSAVLVCALPALLMGFPFPLGLRHQALRQESLVPWAWGINGCLSVVATPLAGIIAVEAGFSMLQLLAAAAYAGALLSSGFLARGRPA
jgi:hypothetical protein